MISIVVARASNGTIGRDGALPWRLPTDLRRFRELTLGHTVLMGRKTFQSLPPAFRPLPGRRNIVLSRDQGFAAQGAEVQRDLRSALAACSSRCVVIGGGATYADTLALAGRVHVTEVDAHVDGDAFFPELAPLEWGCVERGAPIDENGFRFSFCTYERRA